MHCERFNACHLDVPFQSRDSLDVVTQTVRSAEEHLELVEHVLTDRSQLIDRSGHRAILPTRPVVSDEVARVLAYKTRRMGRPDIMARLRPCACVPSLQRTCSRRAPAAGELPSRA